MPQPRVSYTSTLLPCDGSVGPLWGIITYRAAFAMKVKARNSSRLWIANLRIVNLTPVLRTSPLRLGEGQGERLEVRKLSINNPELFQGAARAVPGGSTEDLSGCKMRPMSGCGS